MPCFDRFRSLSTPPIDKIEFPYTLGAIRAHYRRPSTRGGPFPAVVIVQGNDTVKEWMVAFEDLALARGIATLTVDQPGWGESGLTGNRLLSPNDLRNCSHSAVDFLQRRDEIRGQAIGIFGVGLGGLLAPYCAGLEPRFAVVAGLGATFFLKEIWRNLPALQRRRAFRFTGLETLEELDNWFDQLQIEETLSKVHCPALVVHGSQDKIAHPTNAHALVAALRGESELKIVEGADHMCTQFLFKWVADFIFDWMAQRLKQEVVSVSVSRKELAREEEAISGDRVPVPFGQRQVQQVI